MDTKPLEEIGLTNGEIKVYLALLKLGQTTAGPIVDESRVTRSKIYDILERLKNKGLVSYITKESTKYFSAADPHNILEYLNKKEEEIQDEKESINKILPQLLNQQKLAQKSKVAEVFIGMKGMENAFNVLLNEVNPDEDFYVFGAGEGEDIEKIQTFFHRFHDKRAKKKIMTYIIYTESARGLFPTQDNSKFIQARYLIDSSPTAINIYKDYTIIALLTKDPITFLIKNKEVTDSFKKYFKVMWKLAKK